jgi:sialidase-1
MRRSVDSGVTWGALGVVVYNASQNTPVFDAVRGTVVLNFNNAAGDNAQVESTDDGLTWSAVQPLARFLGTLDGSSAGPGVGLQLSAGNPYHPGRILFIGHRGAYIEDVVWFSDDGGATYSVSTTPTGHTLPAMDEAQLVELSNGAVLANMRNQVPQDGGELFRAVAVSTDGGDTFSAPSFDTALPEPVCQATIVRAAPPLGDGSVYFANPGQSTGRENGRVRRSRTCSGLDCQWDNTTLVVAEGSAYGYSCLAPLNETHMGLLWETGAPGCTAVSTACLQVFSIVPLSAFD